MSSRHLLVVTALTSLFIVREAAHGAAGQASQAPAVTLADLLIQDQISQLEARLAAAPRTAETIAFQGEVAYRKGRFDEAERLYRSALQMSDRTARAHFGMGKLALAKLKAADAEKSFLRAIELDAREPLYRFYASEAFTLAKKNKEAEQQLQEYLKLDPKDPERVPMAKAGLDIIAAFRGVEVGEVDAPAQPAPIRFTKALNLLFTEVSINGQGPFKFLIDTGATQTVVGEKVATRLGLKKIASNVMHGVGGEGKLDSAVMRADSLKVGDVTIKNIPLGTLSNPLLETVLDGIIGTPMLADFVMTIDYPKGQLELARKAPETGTVVPVWCLSGLLLTSVDVNGQHKGNFLIDSGADSTLLAHSMAANLGINRSTPGASVSLPIGGVGGLDGGLLMVPSVTLKTAFETKSFPTLMALDLKAMSALIQTEISGVLGYDTWKDYRVTLDYHKAEIRLSK
jgi:predicted aspartyl protease